MGLLLNRIGTLALLIAAVLWAASAESDPAAHGPPTASPVAEAPITYPMIIQNPSSLGNLETDLRDVAGRPVGIKCGTCHAEGSGQALADRDGAPSDLHAGIELVHGELTCNSCHSPDDRTRLRLADGRTLEMDQVVNLCGQCHSGQYESFRNAAHGGARGYWDRNSGPMIRNSCVSCHQAHRPRYPQVLPAPGPNDRFQPESNPHGGDSHD